MFDSPDTPTIATLVALLNERHPRDDGRAWTAADTLKNVVLALTHTNGERELVIVGIPGDRDADLKRAEAAFFPAAVEAATEEDFAAHPALVKGYIGPWSAAGSVLGTSSTSGVRFVVDPRVVEGTAWVTGANEPDRHVLSLVAGRDFVPDGTAEVAEVRAGTRHPTAPGPSSSPAVRSSVTSSRSAASTPRLSACRCSTATASSSRSRWVPTASGSAG